MTAAESIRSAVRCYERHQAEFEAKWSQHALSRAELDRLIAAGLVRRGVHTVSRSLRQPWLRPVRATQAEVELVERLRADGASYAQVAEAVGRSKSWVQRLVRNGWKAQNTVIYFGPQRPESSGCSG